MSPVALDRLLAALVLAIGATGLLALQAASASAAWVFVAHDVAALVLAGAVVVKLARSVPAAIARRSFGRLALGVGLAGAVAVGLVGGVAWVASGRLLALGPLTVLTLHAWAGLAIVPLVVGHLLPGRWRLLGPGAVRAATRRGPGRRTLVRLAALAALGVAGVGAAAAAERLNAGTRRFTGSRWLPAGTVPPPTTFIADTTPAESGPWRLRVHGLVASPRELAQDALAALPQRDTVAVLDCTSGWAVETGWRGVAVADVLAGARPLSDGRRLVVRSATGWAAAFDLAEADRLLLATGVAGGPLPRANGAPCRLVAPDHRGLDWVKWVTELEVV